MSVMKRTGIIHYGMGNLSSVRNAMLAIGQEGTVITSPKEVSKCTHLILPGVGAFGDAMRQLNSEGWCEAMHRHAILQQKPFLGICLGMQLLAETGTEHGSCKGLGWIPGCVTRLSGKNVRVPHIGWNNVEYTSTSELFNGLESGQDFYFVHSYAVRPCDESYVTGWCQHGERFAASLQVGNVFATQFHPEKSQKCGLKLLENFVAC